MTTPPRTPTPLDVAWEALAADIHANGYSVRDAIARHRPPIEAEARAKHEHVYGRFGEDDPLSWTCGVCGLPKPAAPDPAPLDVERLAEALHDYSGWYTDHTGPVCLACTEDAIDIAREYATEVQP